MPLLSAVGRMLGAPGPAPFDAVPHRETVRRLIDEGASRNVAVTRHDAAERWLRPSVLPHTLEQARARVLAAIGMLRGWRLAGHGDDVLWANRTTPMLGFTDDVLVLLTSDGSSTIVEARSASRIGNGDLGRNRSTLRELSDVLRRWK